jgi:hypothetical protein
LLMDSMRTTTTGNLRVEYSPKINMASVSP